MATVKNYRELIAWQKAMDLAVEIYDLSKLFPREEVFGLTSQVRRSGVSIPSNIAEGQGRLTTGEFKNFLGNSRGSLFEAETQIILAQRLEYITFERSELALKNSAEVGKIINGLINSLR